MSNQAISAAVHQLKQEHIRLCKELERVDQALSALGGLERSQGTTGKVGRKSLSTRPKRKVSAAARKKMSEAARARWAARRKEKAA
jgi:hypothetical protein